MVRDFVNSINDIIKAESATTTSEEQRNEVLLYNFIWYKLTKDTDNIGLENIKKFRWFFNDYIEYPSLYRIGKKQTISENTRHSTLFPSFIKYKQWFNNLLYKNVEIKNNKMLYLESKKNIKDILFTLYNKAWQLLEIFELLEQQLPNNIAELQNKQQILMPLLQSLLRISVGVIFHDDDLRSYTLPNFLNDFDALRRAHPLNFSTIEEQEAITFLEDWCKIATEISYETPLLERLITDSMQQPPYITKILDRNTSKLIIKTIELIKIFSSKIEDTFLQINPECCTNTHDSTNHNTNSNKTHSIKIITLDGNIHEFLINENILKKLKIYDFLLSTETNWADKNAITFDVKELIGIFTADSEQSLLLNFFEMLANGKIKYEAVKFIDLITLKDLFNYFMVEDLNLQQTLFNHYMLAYIHATDFEVILEDLDLGYDQTSKTLVYNNAAAYDEHVTTELIKDDDYLEKRLTTAGQKTIVNNFIGTLPQILNQFVGILPSSTLRQREETTVDNSLNKRPRLAKDPL